MKDILQHYENNQGLKSAEVLVPYIINIVKPKSVIDVGCGIGTWLKVYHKNGINEILGIDGYHISPDMLHIDYTKFKKVNLEYPDKILINRKFDLVNCLEVAEHISPDKAVSFVKFLCSLSNIIVFSAALPGQTGENHKNEQYPLYWKKIFNKNGYVFFDVFRKKFWNNNNIRWWYRQNMFLIVSKNLSEKIKFETFDGNSYIHPDLLSYRTLKKNENIGIKKAFILLNKAIIKKFKE